MGTIRKYAFVLLLVLAATDTDAPPSLVELVKLRWLDHINVALDKSLTSAKPEVSVSAVDPVAAANVDEDVDYRIAQRTKSIEGWRSFLAAHPNGPHTQSARAEINKLAPTEKPSAPATAQPSNGGSSNARKLRARSPLRASLPNHPRSPRLPLMKSASSTRIVCSNCPTARRAKKRCGSWRSCAARSCDQSYSG